jgi:hypothetical protein
MSPKPATRRYVDDGLDAQRQYAETLFQNARERLDTLTARMDSLEGRLQEALATIRPVPVVQPPPEPIAALEGPAKVQPPAAPVSPVVSGKVWARITVERRDSGVHIQIR